MSRVELADLDFFSPEVQECPFHVYRQLQDEAPIWQVPNANVFVVTRYNDIREIIRDPARFSSSFSALLNTGSTRWWKPCLRKIPLDTAYTEIWSIKCSPINGSRGCGVILRRLQAN